MDDSCGPQTIVADILKFIEELNQYKDVDTMLDGILSKSRALSNADAGTLYLAENGLLRFSYVQNDTLFTSPEHRIRVYGDMALPVDDSSIVGYVAVSRKPLAIDDAYSLPPHYPFCFNKKFDQETGYHTVSMLTLPLIAAGARLVGVLQLLNAKNGSGAVVPFDQEALTFLPLLTAAAAATIERGAMTRELILRMMRMAELHDPTETGAHVLRVGAYAAEIYGQWARNHGVERDEARYFRDLLRVTAMLHDVGKVGISDMILKKPGPLDQREFLTMKMHTVYGARLFSHTTSEMDRMSANIALNHHEHWDGNGYPGMIEDIMSEHLCLGRGRKGEEIPLEARIAAIADVYDALISKRAYKDAWTEERVVSSIREGAGRQFDPSVVDAFLDVREVLAAIRKRYTSKQPVIEELSLEARIACARLR